MKNILITGGTGYIGRYLTKSLQNSGFAVTITSRVGGDGIRRLDLLETDSIKRVCEEINTVVHLANYDERLINDNPKEALLANAYATRLLYKDANANRVSDFIYFSTFHVYGLDNGTINELSETRPLTDYGLTHLFAEKYLEQLSAQGTTKVKVVRLSNGIGYPPGNCDKWYLIINDCCRNAVMYQKIVLKTAGYQKRNFVAITDVCEAVRILIEANAEEQFAVYNVGSRANINMREIACLVANKYKALSGNDVELVIPDSEEKAVPEFEYSSAKIRGLGWSEKSRLEEVIEDILIQLLNRFF